MKTIRNVAAGHGTHTTECEVSLLPGQSETIKRSDIAAAFKYFKIDLRTDSMLPGFNGTLAKMNGSAFDGNVQSIIDKIAGGDDVVLTNDSDKKVLIAFRAKVTMADPPGKTVQSNQDS